MLCENCGQEAGKKSTRQEKKFCNQNCFHEYLKKGGSSITGEKAFRKELLLHAKQGNKEAREILKRKYNLTAIFDGKEMVKL